MFRSIPVQGLASSSSSPLSAEPFEALAKLFGSDPAFLENLEKNMDIGSILGDLVNERKPSDPSDATGGNPLQQLFGGMLDKMAAAPGCCPVPQQPAAASPPPTYEYEIVESATHLTVFVDMPGVDKASILVSYECLGGSPGTKGKKTLNITSDRKPADAAANVVKSNIAYGKRALSLLLKKASQAASIDDISAKHENGVLAVTVPKENEDARPTQPRYVHIA